MAGPGINPGKEAVVAIETRGSLILTSKLPSKVFKKIRARLIALGRGGEANEIEGQAYAYKVFLADGLSNPFQGVDAAKAHRALIDIHKWADSNSRPDLRIVMNGRVLWEPGMKNELEHVEARRQWWLKYYKQQRMIEFLKDAARKAGFTICASGYSSANYEKLSRPPKRVKKKWSWSDRKLPFKIRIYGTIETSDPNSDGIMHIQCTEQINRDSAARLLPPNMHPVIWFAQSPYHSVVVYQDHHWPLMGVSGGKFKVLTTHKIPQESIDWIDEIVGRLL